MLKTLEMMLKSSTTRLGCCGKYFRLPQAWSRPAPRPLLVGYGPDALRSVAEGAVKPEEVDVIYLTPTEYRIHAESADPPHGYMAMVPTEFRQIWLDDWYNAMYGLAVRLAIRVWGEEQNLRVLSLRLH